MKSEWFRHPPQKRDRIRSIDARHDIEEEVARYFARDKEDEAALEVVDIEQRRGVTELDEEEQRDLEAILALAHTQNLLPSPESAWANTEDAYERLRRSGGNALYPLVRYVREHNNENSPELRNFIGTALRELADESSIPLLLGLMHEEDLAEEASHALDIVIGEMAGNGSPWCDSVGDQLITFAAEARARGDSAGRLRALQALAYTRSTVATEYFASPNKEITPEEQAALSRVPPRRERRLLRGWERDDPYEDDYDYEQDHYDEYERYDRYERYRDESYDDYESRDEHASFRGIGLGVHHGAFRRIPLSLENHGMWLEQGALVGYLNFTPGGYMYYAARFRTEFLLAGYDDFKRYFEEVDRGDFPEVELLIGSTNREMARAALILGFRILNDGWQVAAKPEDVRARLQELEHKRLNGTPLIGRMRERVRSAPVRAIEVAA
jgi:hypothetical protein